MRKDNLTGFSSFFNAVWEARTSKETFRAASQAEYSWWHCNTCFSLRAAAGGGWGGGRWEEAGERGVGGRGVDQVKGEKEKKEMRKEMEGEEAPDRKLNCYQLSYTIQTNQKCTLNWVHRMGLVIVTAGELRRTWRAEGEQQLQLHSHSCRSQVAARGPGHLGPPDAWPAGTVSTHTDCPLSAVRKEVEGLLWLLTLNLKALLRSTQTLWFPGSSSRSDSFRNPLLNQLTSVTLRDPVWRWSEKPCKHWDLRFGCTLISKERTRNLLGTKLSPETLGIK